MTSMLWAHSVPPGDYSRFASLKSVKKYIFKNYQKITFYNGLFIFKFCVSRQFSYDKTFASVIKDEKKLKLIALHGRVARIVRVW